MKKHFLLFFYLLIIIQVDAQNGRVLHPLHDAQWISAEIDTANGPCPIFRKRFEIKKKVKKAVLYITAHGVYEARINGFRVGKAYFTPGWTSYKKRLLFQQYDVSSLLRKANGSGQLLVTIGDGWYRGALGIASTRNNYGRDASLLCRLEIKYIDGENETIISDRSWACGTGPIRRSSIYMGELVDENIAPSHWRPVVVKGIQQSNLQPSENEPITKQERFRPVRIFSMAKNERIVDFGQNIAGWVRINVKGRKGDTIRITHAEVLDSTGNLFMGNLSRVDPTEVYILHGKGVETLEPHFTYHGFRYAQVSGFTPTVDNCEAVAVHSQLEHTGQFSCSNPLINQLQHNIEWSLNSNLFDIPTDCPQRGERLGWTGDAQLILQTAAYNRNVRRFFSKWLMDLDLDQNVLGVVPAIIPNIYSPSGSIREMAAAGWGDAATIIPMDLFEIYGDTELLRRQYPSMEKWVTYELSSVDSSDKLWKAGGFGDWYSMGPGTPNPYVNQCYLIHSLELLMNARKILNIKDGEEGYWNRLLRQSKDAFMKAFVSDSGIISVNTQTAYILALHFNILPEALRSRAAAQLATLIHENGDHLATGFLGTAHILQALTENGYKSLAYTLMEQETAPSWLYAVKKGATTIWEKWNPIDDRGNWGTCSYNHYAYGAVGNWLYRVVAGIVPLEAGYRKVLIAPQPGGSLTWASGTYQSKFGRIVSQWKIVHGEMIMHIEIPTGTEGVVNVPGRKAVSVTAGKYDFTTPIPQSHILQEHIGE